MENFPSFLRAVLSHWVLLAIALIALVLYFTVDFEDYKKKVVVFLIALGSLFACFYLAVSDQIKALN